MPDGSLIKSMGYDKDSKEWRPIRVNSDGEIVIDPIDTDKIADGAITTQKLAANTITDEKIKSHTTTKITLPTAKLTGTIATAQIADGAITTPKIANGTVTDDKLGVGTLKRIRYTDVPSNTTIVDWTGLNISSLRMCKIMYKVPNPTGTNSWLYIFVNRNYNPSNYHTQFLGADNANIQGFRSNTSGLGWLGAGHWTIGDFMICCLPGYTFMATGTTTRRSQGSLQTFIQSISSTFAADPITAIRFQSSVAGTIGAGTKFALFIDV
ncbi:hypothetical protein ES708_17601 [subsurface metagenome]